MKKGRKKEPWGLVRKKNSPKKQTKKIQVVKNRERTQDNLGPESDGGISITRGRKIKVNRKHKGKGARRLVFHGQVPVPLSNGRRGGVPANWKI